MRREILLPLCVLGIYGTYVYYGVLQEEINSTRFGPDGKRFNYSTFMVLIQCIINVIVCFLISILWNLPKNKTPLWRYFFIAAPYLGAMVSSNAAIQYLSYPTVALAKSCKPIPVMLMRLLVLSKKQPLRQYLCVAIISAGISMFMMDRAASKSQSQSNSPIGLLLIIFSLAADGFTGPFQERLIESHSPTSNQMMLYSNIWSCLILVIALAVTGWGISAIQFCIEFPQVFWKMFLCGILGAIGQNFIYFTLFKFGSVVLSLVTTTRKFVTVLGSVFWFGHALTPIQWLAVLVVFSGLVADLLFSKLARKPKPHAEKRPTVTISKMEKNQVTGPSRRQHHSTFLCSSREPVTSDLRRSPKGVW